MAKRKTIGENPLDALATNPSPPPISTQLTGDQPSGQADLLSRMQAVENQAVLMRWLIYGAIGLAIVL